MCATRPVFLVVMFITLLQAAVARSTVVFMKLAEDQVGEYDIQMSPVRPFARIGSFASLVLCALCNGAPR